MYQPMLFLHWKQVRMALALLTVAAFGLPLLAIEGLGTPPGWDAPSLEAYRLVLGFQAWLPAFPFLAGSVGVTLALTAWHWDHQQNHVYSLSLPLTRWEFAMAKMGAGVTLALIPVVAFWMGAHVASASLTLPTGLNAYPNELTVRFLFAILLAYGLTFALAAGTVKTTLWVIGAVFGFIFFGLVVNDLLAPYIAYFDQVNVLEAVGEWLLTTPGPLEVFSGSWSLIDV